MHPLKVKYKSKKSQARLSGLKTSHGIIETPLFMPIATVGAVKTLSSADLKTLGAQIILSNTYHLLLRPGINLMKKACGLHKFMNWEGPILTDSGGFQVYSLSKIRKVNNTGVTFRSHIDGQKFALTPAKALKIQSIIGSDIAMLLDECVGYPATREQIEASVKRTTFWAEKSREFMQKNKKTNPRLRSGREKQKNPSAGDLPKGDNLTIEQYNNRTMTFAINQGGIYKDLRLKSARELVKLNFDGYAIGGLAVGEPWEKAVNVLDWVIPELPEEKPRYLMGVGYPEQIVDSVKKGVDMFDCVIPTREARHGKLYAWKKSAKELLIINYQTLNILNSKFTHDFTPINQFSKILELREYTKSYLHHLFKIGEPLGQRLATLNNLEFYLNLMREIRRQIKQGEL